MSNGSESRATITLPRSDDYPLDIACPFCPLRCMSAFQIKEPGGPVRLGERACSSAHERFQRWQSFVPSGDARAIRPGDPSWQPLVQRLAAARSIEIGGTIVDIGTARAAVRAAALMRGRLVPGSSPSADAFRGAVQRDGCIGATLGELWRRADRVVMVGDVLAEYPRILDGWEHRPQVPLHPGKAPVERAVMVLAPGAGGDGYPDGTRFESVPADTLHHRLAVARTSLRRARFNEDPLVQWMENGQYIVWLWRSDILNPRSVSQLVGINSDLNRTHRSVLIPMDSHATLRTVASWLTGLVASMDFADTLPRVIEPGTCGQPDIRIWLQPFPDSSPPPDDSVPLVIVGAADEDLRRRTEGYVRVAAPALEVGGVGYRGDGTVCVSFGTHAAERLPTADEALAVLAQAVHQRRSAE